MIDSLSLHARIALIAVVAAIAAMAVVAYSTTLMVAVAVNEALDDKMDFQIGLLEKGLSADGTFDLKAAMAIPEYGQSGGGWGWSITTPRGEWHGGSRITRTEFPVPRVNFSKGTYSGRANSDIGEYLHLRRRELRLRDGPVVITLATPHQLVTGPVAKVQVRFAVLLALLAAVLLGAMYAQLRVGLHPIRRLERDVGKLRSGEAESVQQGDTAELRAVTAEINALISRNVAGLESARGHVANLAHAIKTPLASLALQLEHEQASPESRKLVAHIERSIAHHLRRARSGAANLGGRARCDAGAVVRDLVVVMKHMHRDNPITVHDNVIGPLIVAVDAEDLSEMLGNLLHNACRFAGSTVRVSARIRGRRAVFIVEDDGPGIPADQVVTALKPGIRLDEVPGGYGFGLAITNELSGLYGGVLRLEASASLGGLCATLGLPRRPTDGLL